LHRFGSWKYFTSESITLQKHETIVTTKKKALQPSEIQIEKHIKRNGLLCDSPPQMNVKLNFSVSSIFLGNNTDSGSKTCVSIVICGGATDSAVVERLGVPAIHADDVCGRDAAS
jgi:hypothetical protein